MELFKTILYYITVAFLLLYILVLLVSPGSMMDVFGFRTFFVLSNSMEPVINVNDLIITTSIDEEDIEVGDIVSFKVYLPSIKERAVVTHYIGDIQQIGETTIYQTQGEFQEEGVYDSWEDESGNRIYITYEDIEGKYIFKIPYVGHIQDIVSNRTFVTMVIVNIGVVYIIYHFIKREKQES